MRRRDAMAYGAALCSPFTWAQPSATEQIISLEEVRFVHGGMSEWAKRGWPMVAPA